MKLTLLLSLFLLIAVTTSAQIKKGSIQLGLDAGFYGNKTTQSVSGNTDSDNFYFSPSVGKAIKDNLFIGLNATVSIGNRTDYNGASKYEDKSRRYGGSIWIRQYYPIGKSFYLFLNGSAGVSANTRKYITSQNITSSKTKGVGINAVFYPGISYQIKKNFFLDASLNNLVEIYYNRDKNEFLDQQGNMASIIQKNYGVVTSLGNGSNPLQFGLRWIFTK